MEEGLVRRLAAGLGAQPAHEALQQVDVDADERAADRALAQQIDALEGTQLT